MAEDLPREVRDLVTRKLHNMEDIEILLLLAEEGSPMRVASIGERLRMSGPAPVLAAVHRLVAASLLATETAAGETLARYAPETSAIRRAVDLLRIAYNERPVTLVRLVYNRRSAAQSFADAFRVTRGADDQ